MSGKEVSAKVTVLCLHCQAVLSGRDKVEDRIAVVKKEGVVASSLLAQCWESGDPLWRLCGDLFLEVFQASNLHRPRLIVLEVYDVQRCALLSRR